jgi:hypothetical protein
MESVKALLSGVLVIAFAGALLFVLWGIIRFSVVSPFRTRGARDRMRRPDPDGIEGLVGFPVPAPLVGFYRSWPHLEKSEFFLVDPATGRDWFIGGFQPLALVDAKEMIAASRVPGLPIAGDMNKGVYFIDPAGQVELWSPNVPGGRALVANSIDELARFRVAEHEDIHPDENA